MEKLSHLRGMRDTPQESWRSQQAAHDHLREYFYSHGYQVLETPVLEPTELFLRKSGGELAARMYTFTDPGGNQASLRPEYTASILRHYLEGEGAERLPVRIQYAGPVFRYEADTDADRQFTQIGAELLGSSSPRADAEILSLSCMALSSLGLSGYRLEVGDLGVLYRLLDSLELSERAIAFILGSIGELREGQEGLRRVSERATQLRILAADAPQSYLSSAIGGMEEDEARKLLRGMVEWVEVGSMGQRGPSEVVERLLRKLRGADDPARFERGLEVAYRLAQVRGEPERCLSEVRELTEEFTLDTSVLERLTEVIGLLDLDQLDGATVALDFGLARGLAYYTGIVFEITHPALKVPLGGGGRYDGLARALGSPSSVPALGFAYSLESLLEALDHAEKPPGGEESRPARVLVSATNATAYAKALGVARQLRQSGTPAEMEVSGMGLEESLSYARAKDIAEVILVDSDGKSTTYPV